MLSASFLTDQLLISMPSMGDPNFARTVTFVCQHNADGAFGLVLNRGSDYTWGELMAQMKIGLSSAALAQRQVLVGGPVQQDRGFVLHSREADYDSSFAVSASLAVTTSRDVLEALARGQGPGRATVALGYAGWGAGQLEREIRENSWLHVDATPELIFDVPLAQRYDIAAARLGIDLRQLTDYAGHA